jgi:toxin-antitoxin system PIN domain toxin
MRALLDVNVLIALLDAAHIHHDQAMSWLESHVGEGWASCPITQNGCLRIMSQPAYPGALPVALVAERLAEAADQSDHEFWPDDIDMLNGDMLDWSRVLGNRQLTDAYLLALAVRHDACLVTLDRRISIEAVKGAVSENLAVIF